jgi:mannitol-1-phosphate 5-dehydrogenase
VQASGLDSKRVMVGIGAGAIQLGLWAYYAFLDGAEIVLAEIDRQKVESVRANNHLYTINIAHFDRIAPITVGPIGIYSPTIAHDRAKILESIAIANDIVTAVPSTHSYELGGVAELLRDGLAGRARPVTIYASENEVGAARKLERLVYGEKKPAHVRFADTVIERMGGTHTNRDFIEEHGLQQMTPSSGQALLVEDFDKVIVEKGEIPDTQGYSTVFGRFMPTAHIGLYEELKLLGHNAVHFLLGCIGELKGYTYMSDYNGDSDLGYLGSDALLQETGGWFRSKHQESGEAVATDRGFKDWASQVVRRIVNPFLYDTVDRIVRDPQRKLRWNDRMAWTMREAVAVGIEPRRYALGVAAAVMMLSRHAGRERLSLALRKKTALDNLAAIWGDQGDTCERSRLLAIVDEAIEALEGWSRADEPSVYRYLRQRAYLPVA